MLHWSLVGNTSGFGHAPAGYPTWIGNFSGSGHTEILFYSPGDTHFWLGSYADASLTWKLVATGVPPIGGGGDGGTVYVAVPDLVGSSLKLAIDALNKAGLKLGYVYNSSNEVRTDHLQVVTQSPNAAQRVATGSYVSVTVKAVATTSFGVASFSFHNCNTDGRSVTIYYRRSGEIQWTLDATLATQYDSQSNTCPAPGAGASTVTFEDGQTYEIIALDQGLIGCDGNPDTTACRRWSATVQGDASGPKPIVIVS